MTEQNILNGDVFKIDAKKICEEIESFIKQKLLKSHREGIVVAISGGLDSSVVATLCTRAVGSDKVKGLMLPERFGNPEANYYGKIISKHLGIEVNKINISPVLRGLKTADPIMSVISGRMFWKDLVIKSMEKRGHSIKGDYIDFLKGKLDLSKRKTVAKFNSKNRARAIIAYKYADENNYMVVGASHKTETTVGLFCKYGIDDCADVMPLKNLYRSHILQLAEYLELPVEILQRSPNPDFLPGVTDKYQSYFGMDYLKIDLIIYALEKGFKSSEVARQLEITEETVIEIQEIIKLNDFMRDHSTAPAFGF